MVTKKFIDPRNSISFKLVHRSQRDSRINDENAPDLLLQQLPPSRNLQVGVLWFQLSNLTKLFMS